ncbi:hypothetical protein YC2023_072547 [Brassica napus]
MELTCLIYNKYQIISQKKKLRKNKSTEVSLLPMMVRSIAHRRDFCKQIDTIVFFFTSKAPYFIKKLPGGWPISSYHKMSWLEQADVRKKLDRKNEILSDLPLRILV